LRSVLRRTACFIVKFQVICATHHKISSLTIGDEIRFHQTKIATGLPTLSHVISQNNFAPS